MLLERRQFFNVAAVPFTVSSTISNVGIDGLIEFLTGSSQQAQQINPSKELADLINDNRDKLPTEDTDTPHGRLKYLRRKTTQQESELYKTSANAYFDILYLIDTSPDKRLILRLIDFYILRDGSRISLNILLSEPTTSIRFYDLNLDGTFDEISTSIIIASRLYQKPMFVNFTQQNPTRLGVNQRSELKPEKQNILDEQFEYSLRRGITAVRDYVK